MCSYIFMTGIWVQFSDGLCVEIAKYLFQAQGAVSHACVVQSEVVMPNTTRTQSK